MPLFSSHICSATAYLVIEHLFLKHLCQENDCDYASLMASYVAFRFGDEGSILVQADSYQSVFRNIRPTPNN